MNKKLKMPKRWKVRKKLSKRWKTVNFLVIFLIMLTVVAWGLSIYNSSLNLNLSKTTNNTLEEIMQQQKYSFLSKIQGEVAVIKTLSGLITAMTEQHPGLQEDNESILKALKHATVNSGFSHLLISDLEGNAIRNDDAKLNVSQEDYFKKALSGETFLSNTRKSKVDGSNIVVFSTPVKYYDETVAVLFGTYKTEELDKLFLSSFSGMGYAIICNLEGNIIAQTSANKVNEDNYNKDDIKYLKNDSEEEIIRKLKMGQSGQSVFELNGQVQLMHYAPLGVNDWIIATIVADDVISKSSNEILANAMLLTTGIILMFLILIVYLVATHKKHSDNLFKTAYFDELTGVPNRAKFKIDALKITKNNPDKKHIAITLDIRHFKVINELFDFAIGDEVITNIAKALTEISAGKNFTFARIGADKFVVFDSLDTEDYTEDFQEKFETRFAMINGTLGNHRLEFRYGVYFTEPGENDINDILQKVDLAHSIAKNQKNSVICEYNDEFKTRVIEETKLEDRMESALKNNEFKVYLQPKYLLKSDTVVGAEALVRWKQDDGSIISPGKFIPLFEKNGFITKLDMYMLEKVCQIIREWMDNDLPIVTVSVNFSRLHLQNENFVEEIEAIAQRYGVPKKYIEIELTESTIFKNEEVLENIIYRLHNAGFTLSMDDFGTGYSSLGLLKNLPVDVIKIDRGFFMGSKYKTRTKTVIANVMKMAKELGIHTVAEGVETQEHIDFLREVGCDIVQGYYYARPVPADDFVERSSLFTPMSNEPEDEPDFSGLIDLKKTQKKSFTEIPIYVHRLFQITLTEVLIDKYGIGEMTAVFRDCGKMAGRAFVQQNIIPGLPFDEFLKELSEKLREAKLGILNIERYDKDTDIGLISVGDYLNCTCGLGGKNLCSYEEGFISGILYEYTKKNYSVVETECKGSGSNICRFSFKPQ